MELNKTGKLPYFVVGISAAMILLLGAWWLYLVFRLSETLRSLNVEKLGINTNIVKMVQWEGLTFFICLLALLITLLYVYFQDLKKTHALQKFLASLTHELKTPLASMRLNSQVVSELIEDNLKDSELTQKINKYTKRLAQDSMRLENELDKSLHLSRIEKGGALNLTQVNLVSFLETQMKRYPDLKYTTQQPNDDLFILADEYALSIIIRNLLDNSLRHNTELKEVSFKITTESEKVKLTYHDFGKAFQGDIKNLGKLFYKFDSPKGSGIGLYLIKNLSFKMKAKFTITHEDRLHFHFDFSKAKA